MIYLNGVHNLAWSFPGGSNGKESVGNVGDQGSIPGSEGYPEKGNGNPLHLPGEFHGQRSLVSYSPWSHKKSDTIERLTRVCVRAHTHTHTLAWILAPTCNIMYFSLSSFQIKLIGLFHPLEIRFCRLLAFLQKSFIVSQAILVFNSSFFIHCVN